MAMDQSDCLILCKCIIKGVDEPPYGGLASGRVNDIHAFNFKPIAIFQGGGL